jgi:hypothetical protein
MLSAKKIYVQHSPRDQKDVLWFGEKHRGASLQRQDWYYGKNGHLE